MIIGFGNNVVSSLAADITATQTTIQVMPGAGALFAGLLSYDYANDSNPSRSTRKLRSRMRKKPCSKFATSPQSITIC